MRGARGRLARLEALENARAMNPETLGEAIRRAMAGEPLDGLPDKAADYGRLVRALNMRCWLIDGVLGDRFSLEARAEIAAAFPGLTDDEWEAALADYAQHTLKSELLYPQHSTINSAKEAREWMEREGHAA